MQWPLYLIIESLLQTRLDLPWRFSYKCFTSLIYYWITIFSMVTSIVQNGDTTDRFPHVCCFGYHMRFLLMLLMQHVHRYQVMVYIKWHISIWSGAYKWNIDFKIDIWNILAMMTGLNTIFIKYSYPYTNQKRWKYREMMKFWHLVWYMNLLCTFCRQFAFFPKTLTNCN